MCEICVLTFFLKMTLTDKCADGSKMTENSWSVLIREEVYCNRRWTCSLNFLPETFFWAIVSQKVNWWNHTVDAADLLPSTPNKSQLNFEKLLENFFNRNNGGAKTKSKRRKRFHWDKICCLRQRPFLLISNIYSKFFCRFLNWRWKKLKEAHCARGYQTTPFITTVLQTPAENEKQNFQKIFYSGKKN
jgi:hypothetical protein